MWVERGGIAILAAMLATFVGVVTAPRPAQGNCAPAVERQRIEALLGAVAQLTEPTFIRNGRSYSAATAAEFLRRKWRAREADVCSAEDFIAKVASFSSTTGKPYLVRLSNGREVPAADFFRTQLAELEQRQRGALPAGEGQARRNSLAPITSPGDRSWNLKKVVESRRS